MYPHGYTTGDENDEVPWNYSPTPKSTNYGNDVPPWNIDTSIFKSPKPNKHMGEMADLMLDQAMWDDPDWDDEDDIRPKVPEGYWKKKDGTLIEIKKMTDDHLRNSIALCRRNGCYRLAEILSEELHRRAKLMEQYRLKRNPFYAAFSAGWDAGHKAAYDDAYPDVGISMTQTKEGAWKQYNEKIQNKQ